MSLNVDDAFLKLAQNALEREKLDNQDNVYTPNQIILNNNDFNNNTENNAKNVKSGNCKLTFSYFSLTRFC